MDYQILDTIKQACRTQTILRIIYTEIDGTNEGWRNVEPYSFRGEGESEALFAWDVHKDGIRRFTLSRINQAETTLDNFSPRYPIEII
jgi:predicted DNA-binding transcriptional regulator YafY